MCLTLDWHGLHLDHRREFLYCQMITPPLPHPENIKRQGKSVCVNARLCKRQISLRQRERKPSQLWLKDVGYVCVCESYHTTKMRERTVVRMTTENKTSRITKPKLPSSSATGSEWEEGGTKKTRAAEEWDWAEHRGTDTGLKDTKKMSCQNSTTKSNHVKICISYFCTCFILCVCQREKKNNKKSCGMCVPWFN